MAMLQRDGRGPRSEINVTPLVDVALVLLIVFMVVTPMLQRGKDVPLPRARVVDEDRGPGDPLIVSVTLDGRIFVGQDEYDARGLERRLHLELVPQPTRAVLVKGDGRVTVGAVRKVLAVARAAGARGVRIAVEQIGETP
jgi:biopolymer transport protein ExbD